MAGEIVDPDRFQLAAALVDWLTLARRDASYLRAVGDRRAKTVQLRWAMHPELGYPTRPFEVWRRPALHTDLEEQLPTGDPAFLYPTAFGWTAYLVPKPATFVRATIAVTAPTVTVGAFAAAPLMSTLLGIEQLTSGVRTVSFSGANVGSLVIWGAATLQSWRTIPTGITGLGDWELIEYVGLPVDPAAWAGVHSLTDGQGPPTALTTPVDAALNRFTRGAAPYGWASALATGRLAPPWRQADPKAFLRMLDEDALPQLRTAIATQPPNAQVGHTEVSQLTVDGNDPATATYSPLAGLLLAAATDPVASLLTGFGTAFDDVDLPAAPHRLGTDLNDPTRCDYDFKVVAVYDDGSDGHSPATRYAALALAPKLLVPPPPAANLTLTTTGMRAPAVTDAPWNPTIILGWDRLPPTLALRTGSYGYARADGSAAVARDLLIPRKYDVATAPIGIAGTDTTAGLTQVRGSDDTFALPGIPPSLPLLYGVAQQDIFGVWSPWRTASITVEEPPVQRVAILSASLRPIATGNATCPATLTVEFTWDWTIRSPASISFTGRLYPLAKRNDPPPAGPSPAGLQRSLAGAVGPPAKVEFGAAGQVFVDAGVTLTHLSADGLSVLSMPSAEAGVRRYRLSITGFDLDFAATGHIGLELMGYGVERRPPMRVGPPSYPATLVSASDPRPPVIVTEHEDVLLASLPDASGCSHAALSWPAAPNAAGYFIYTAAESKLRSDWNMGLAPSGTTLSDRLVALRNAFGARPAVPEGQFGDPARRYFTRINDTPLTATTYSAALPRGTRDIHLFMIVGVSPGGVESTWPDAGDALRRKRPIAYAAPTRLVPTAPTVAAQRVPDPATPDGFATRLTISNTAGVPVDRVDLHRVRNQEAALQPDSMGPPVATVTTGTPGWLITPVSASSAAPAQPLGVLSGIDVPAGDWRPIYYCARAWSAADPTRGLLAARSAPSAVCQVLVPPAGPPPLSTLTQVTGGADAQRVEVSATTTVPLEPTPLGEHRIRLEVHARDGGAEPFVWPGPGGDPRLSAISTTAPADTGLWLEQTGGTTRLRLRVRRPTLNAALRVRMQLDDPLGRYTERVLDVPAATALPPLRIGPVARTLVPGGGVLLRIVVNARPDRPASYRARITVTRPPVVAPRLVFDNPFAAMPLVGPAVNPQQLPNLARIRSDAEHTTLALMLADRPGQLHLVVTGPDGGTAELTQEVQA